MASIVYLDVDDEITTAAARIRSANAPRVGMFIPFGSRVATSRINFRLLAREAQDAKRRLDVVAPDASARALAASAGLPVFASVAEYEAALESGAAAAIDQAAATAAVPPWQAPAGAAGSRRSGPSGGAPGSAEGTHVSPAGAERKPPEAAPQGRRSQARPATEAEAASLATGGRSAAAFDAAARDVPVTASAGRRGRRAGILILVLALALVLAVGGAAAAVALPSADITVTPVLEAVPPISVTVRADTTATASDPTALVIPATSVDVPVTAQGDFPVTGVSIQQTAAAGQVTWTNCDPGASYTIPRGTEVQTASGVAFVLNQAIFLPVAIVSGSGSHRSLQCQPNDGAVTAVKPGPAGNVAAGAIRVIPSSYNRNLLSVSNASATSGGTRTELPKIAADDVAAARAKLATDLTSALATALADPTLAPQGTRLFPDTARLGDPTFTPDPAGLAGKVLKAGQTTFTLKADATATATAIDETPLKAIGEAAVRAAVKPGYQIVDSSIQVTVGDGTVGEDGTVSYPVSASALEQRPLDAAALKASVLGKSEADAAAALAQFGRVSITLWPFWVTGVPTSGDRVTVSIATPVAPAPTPTPLPTKARASEKSSASPPASTAPSGSPVPSA